MFNPTWINANLLTCNSTKCIERNYMIKILSNNMLGHNMRQILSSSLSLMHGATRGLKNACREIESCIFQMKVVEVALV